MHWAAWGAVSAGLAVVAGAFGAHALRSRLGPDLLAIFETAVRYQLVHALALLVLGLASSRLDPRAVRGTGLLLAFGTVLFSGSLYALALSGVRALGAITPLGGLCWIAAWIVLARALFRAAPPAARVLAVGVGLAGLGATGCRAQSQAPPPAAPERFAPASGIRLERVVDGLDHPLHLTAPAGDPRLFVVEQGGTIRIVRGGNLVARPFLDLSSRLRSGGERGLLSMAFHPGYRTNGFFFVNYTDRRGDTRVERYRVSRDPDVADPATARLVLEIEQPYANHNGGHVLFGPDGMLYVGTGDGGSGGDPGNRAQNPRELLGKLLRLDVDAAGSAPYAIPPDNPYAGEGGGRGRPEIWALGLRNPWRCAFDPPTGLLYIADVGQNQWEEVHVEPAAKAGINYGWNLMEGRHPYRPAGRSTAGLALPPVEYSHGDGCSIAGGAVYRGAAVPALVGHYVFSDYCTGWIRSFRFEGGRATDLREWRGVEAGNVMSFGVDAAGELYVLSADGAVRRFARAPAAGP